MTEPIEAYDKPSPTDKLDEGQSPEEMIDDILATRAGDRSTTGARGPVGEITNPEVQRGDHFADADATEPFDDGPGRGQ